MPTSAPLSVRRCLPPLIVLLAVAATVAQSVERVHAEDFLFPEKETGDLEEPDRDVRKRDLSPNSDGPGLDARAGHIGFKTFGRNESITHVELMPFFIVDDEMLFADFRLFMTNDGQFGGNTGVGMRHFVASWERVFGAGLWYDIDSSTDKVFHQAALSLETYGFDWDFRSNLYFPIDDDEKDFSRRAANIRFAGNGLLYDRVRDFGEAMPGVDLEFGIPLPTDFAREHDLRAYGGWYSFWGDAVDDINGYKARVEGSLNENIHTQVEWTDDDTFGRNVTVGIALTTSGGFQGDHHGRRSKAAQLRRYVQRNYNIIVSKQTNIDRGLTAINPATGAPYIVQHVSSSGNAVNPGTADAPLDSIAAAQAAGGDIIFVHSGSVLNDAVVLQSGDRILGEGATHTFLHSEFGMQLLPRATGGNALPVLQNIAGDAVTLSSSAEFAGFTIDTPSGHGITGTGDLSGAVIRNVAILTPVGDGLFLDHANGRVEMRGVNVTDAGGAGVRVSGGSANFVLSGAIQNSTGRALLVENTTGGVVDLSSTSIIDNNGGDGLLLSSVDGSVIVGDTSLLNPTGIGIDIQGGSGSIHFSGDTSIDTATGVGINVENSAGDVRFNSVDVVASNGNVGVNVINSTGMTAFDHIDVTATNAVGLFVADSGTISTGSGSLSATGASAVDIENTEMDVTLTSVFSDGAVNGIRIVDSAGQFIIRGNGSFGSGGLIQNATTGVLMVNSGTVALQYLDLDANAVGVSATDSDRLVFARGRTTNSGGLAVDTLNVAKVEVSNSELDAGVRLHSDTVLNHDYRIIGNVMETGAPAAFEIATLATSSSLTLTATHNDITIMGANSAGFDIDWDGLLVTDFNDNVITGTGGSNTGIDITTTSTTALADIGLLRNAFRFDGGGDTGMRLETAGPSVVSISSSEVEFNAAGGTGFEFLLAKSANVSVRGNLITDNAEGGTGILFTSIAGPSNVLIEGNQIDLLSPSAVIDRGIIFTAIDDSIDDVSLSGSLNNIINGASTDFFAPGGTTSGTIPVNGANVP